MSIEMRFALDSSNHKATVPMQAFDAILGLGSNLGDKRANIERAIQHLTADGAIRLVRRSHDYRSAPWGKTDQDWFVNACISVTASLSPHELLERCFDAERHLKRVRQERWGPRSLDCDLLIMRDVAMNTPELALPHPRITERAFVLVPMLEIGPDLIIKGHSLSQWLSRLDAADVVAMA
jgi:2-amino-4-hydroxy-6-hydroxymethyldihydropteridine diphosphokinase